MEYSMDETKHRIEALKGKIRSGFANTRHPGPDKLALHECDECQAVRDAFARVDWKTLDDEVIKANFDKLPLFSPEAFHFFLPAYILYSLTHLYSEACAFMVYALTPKEQKRNEAERKAMLLWWQERLKPFSQKQMGIVYEFLDIVKDEEGFRHDREDIDLGKKKLREFAGH